MSHEHSTAVPWMTRGCLRIYTEQDSKATLFSASHCGPSCTRQQTGKFTGLPRPAEESTCPHPLWGAPLLSSWNSHYSSAMYAALFSLYSSKNQQTEAHGH